MLPLFEPIRPTPKPYPPAIDHSCFPYPKKSFVSSTARGDEAGSFESARQGWVSRGKAVKGARNAHRRKRKRLGIASLEHPGRLVTSARGGNLSQDCPVLQAQSSQIHPIVTPFRRSLPVHGSMIQARCHTSLLSREGIASHLAQPLLPDRLRFGKPSRDPRRLPPKRCSPGVPCFVPCG